MYFFHHTYTRQILTLKKLKHFYFVVAFLLLTACSSESANQNLAKNAEQNPEPPKTYSLSPALNTIFNETCAKCHMDNATGAPKAGDAIAWDKILSKGMDATLDRVMNGYGGMPPAGQCFECSPEQLLELIRYMSSEA